MFLKSFNDEDLSICSCFLPEITDPSHMLYKKYYLLKDELFAISKQLGLQKSKTQDKENRNWGQSKVFGGGYKSLLNSAKFLSRNGLVAKNKKLTKQLFALSMLIYNGFRDFLNKSGKGCHQQ